jgi:hypothetical protein
MRTSTDPPRIRPRGVNIPQLPDETRSARGYSPRTRALVRYNDALSDDYDSDEIDARGLWRIWRERSPTGERAETRWGEGAVRLSGLVSGDAAFGCAPFAVDISGYESEPFLDHYTVPIEVATGDPIQWMRLAIGDKWWRDGRNDKGGVSQEATGWKPSPLQPVF